MKNNYILLIVIFFYPLFPIYSVGDTISEAHQNKEFDRIEYCKNCDFLDGDPEVLVWSNDNKARVNHMLGTDDEFTLTDPKYI